LTAEPTKPKLNIPRLMFTAMSISFTGLSLYHGFGWYDSWFGFDTAIMISVSIEVGSIALFWYVLWVPVEKYHVPIVLLIIALRLWCGVVNYTAFSQEVHLQYIESTSQMYKKVQNVLPEYREYIRGLLKKEMPDIAENILMKNKGINEAGFEELNRERKRPYLEEKANLGEMYEITPQNIAEYRSQITRMASVVPNGMVFDLGDTSGKESALQATWPIGPETAKLTIGAILSIWIELMILTGLLMGRRSTKIKSTTKSTTAKNKSTIKKKSSPGRAEKNWEMYYLDNKVHKPRDKINPGLRDRYDIFLETHKLKEEVSK